MNQKRHTHLKNKKKLKAEDQMIDAKVWLQRLLQQQPKSLIQAYSKRYSVSQDVSVFELSAIGFQDQVRIEVYERDGVEWEYRVDGYTGDLKVVPKGVAEWELILY